MVLCQDVPGLILFGGKTYNNMSIVRSTDYGDTWATVLNESSVEIIEIIEIKQDPHDLSHLIAGGRLESPERTVFYHSHDHGESWVESPDPLYDIEVNDILFSEILPGRFLCGTDNGIYRTDDGVIFTQVLGLETMKLESDPDRPGELYAACAENGVFYSTDEGDTWQPLPALYRNDIQIETVELVGDQWLYAGTDGFGVFRLPLGPLGIQNHQEEFFPVSVLATPALNTVTLIVNPGNASSTLTVYDISGRVQYSTSLTASEESQSIVLNNLSPGIYFAGISDIPHFCRFVMLRE